MSTPIEIVRAHRLSLAYPNAGIATQAYAKEIAALDAVLRDAERFKALEAFMQNMKHEVPCIERGTTPKEVWYGALSEHTQYVTGSTLAELADRLREGAT